MSIHKILFLMISLVFISGISAGVYEAGGGAGFYLTYPDNWYRVPYGEVNAFLGLQKTQESAFNYNAVLAKRTDGRFFEVPYIFIYFESTGQPNDKQIDSVLKSLSYEYGYNYVEASLTEGDIELGNDQPVYDKESGVIAVLSNISIKDNDKTLLELRKFYNKGVVVFFCYAPKEMYQTIQPVFFDIFRSFSTTSPLEGSSEDNIKVVDLSKRESPSGTNVKSSKAVFSIITLIAVIIILAMAILIIMMRRNRK